MATVLTEHGLVVGLILNEDRPSTEPGESSDETMTADAETAKQQTKRTTRKK